MGAAAKAPMVTGKEKGMHADQLHHSLMVDCMSIEPMSNEEVLLNIHTAVENINFHQINQSMPLGGRLSKFKNNWILITQDQTILEAVEGYKIEFEKFPLPFATRAPSLSEKENQAINLEIQEMIEKGAVEIVEPPPDNYQVVSHLFVRPKKDGGLRPIFNLKRLNENIKYQHFKMEGFHVVKHIIQMRDWMIKIDL